MGPFPLPAIIMAYQSERAFQKQANVFLNKKRLDLKSGKAKTPRYTKSIGLGFKTPREAIDGHYIDKKCPFTGNVSIRSHPDWCRHQDEDEPHHRDPSGLPALHQKVQPV